MAQDSKIEWCNHTANLWWGCTEVHAGCDNCYARVLSHRWGFELWGNESPRRMIVSVWKDLTRYQKIAAEAGVMHTVFVGSMMDIFEKAMPLILSDGTTCTGLDTDHLRRMLFERISNGEFPNLIFLFLTKRPSNINKYIPESWKTHPPANVMFGTSPVNQETANTLIPQLAKVAGKKFLSVEPMLGPIDITNKGIKNGYSFPTGFSELNGKRVGIEWTDPGDSFIGVDWVICGGESGHGKRPINPDWARSLRDQCFESNQVPFFMKQMDKVEPIPLDLFIRQFPEQFLTNQL